MLPTRHGEKRITMPLPPLSALSLNRTVKEVGAGIPKNYKWNDPARQFTVTYDVKHVDNISDGKTLTMVQTMQANPEDLIFKATISDLAETSDRAWVAAWLQKEMTEIWGSLEIEPTGFKDFDENHNCSPLRSLHTSIWRFDQKDKDVLQIDNVFLHNVGKVDMYDEEKEEQQA